MLVFSLYGLVGWTRRHQEHKGTEVDYDYDVDDKYNDDDAMMVMMMMMLWCSWKWPNV